MLKYPLKIALFTSGLGYAQRGFEISTARFHRALKPLPDFDVQLFAGGHYPDTRKVRSLDRAVFLRALKPLKAVLGSERLWKTAYALEQTSFAFGILEHHGRAWQPDIVWTKEVPLAHVLYEFRKLFGLRYKLVFANGGGFKPKTYAQFDHIQHLQPEAYSEATAYGIAESKMTLLPNCVPYSAPKASKSSLRQKYGFNDDDYIIISVAAWNTHHKRIDYLIGEFAKLRSPDCKLLLVGQPEPAAEALKELGERLCPDKIKWLSVPESEVRDLLHMSDLFTLTSLYEGLGSVIIEAAQSGLPILCHPHAGAKFILEEPIWLQDMQSEGALAGRIEATRANPPRADMLSSLQNKCIERFSEERIAKAFANMVNRL